MKILGILLLASAAVLASARHKKEWQKVDVHKLALERPLKFYISDKPACVKGAGFYRDPQNCHQFIRCVDEYGNGRQFSVFVGRCDPGLVFDENVSACNWPELAAPCSASPPKLQDTQKPIRQQQVPEENAVYEETWKKPYPEQQQVFQETQESDSYVPQKEAAVVQEPVYEDQPNQIMVETQNTDKQIQEQVHEEKIQEPELQQVYDEDVQTPEIQEQVHEEKIQEPELQQVYEEDVQTPEIQEQDPVQAFEQEKQNAIQSEVVYEDQNEQDGEIFVDSRPNQVPVGGFEPVIDQEISQQVQQDGFQQQNSQSNWWVPENKPQHSPPEAAEQIPVPDSIQQPFFCSEEGFYRHPHNCSQFIRCVQIGGRAFAVHFFECPKLLVFSEKDSSCIVPDSNKCKSNYRQKREASNTKLKCKGEGFFRHPDDCRAFYRCVKTQSGYYETHHFSCPANLVFDEEYTTCNWPEKAPPCNSQQQYKPTRKPAKQVQTQRTTNRPFREPVRQGQTQRTTYRPFREPVTQVQTRRTTYRPFREPVRQVQTQRTTYRPYRELAKQVQTRRTTYKPLRATPWSTTMIRTRSTAKPRNDFMDKFITGEVFGKRFSTQRPRLTTLSYRSGPRCRSAGFFRNDNDCARFSKCVKKGNRFIRYDLSCPNNFAFDDRSKKCVAQRYVSLCNRNSPPYPSKQDYYETTAVPEATRSSSRPGNDASACKREGYFRNPEDCNRFYRCVNFEGSGNEFVRYDFKCPDGLTFDEENNVCNWPDQSAPCDARGGERGGGTGGDVEIDGNETGEKEGDDGRDWESGGRGTPTTQPPRTTTSWSVDGSEEESGSPGTGSANECTKEGFYRNPDDCNKFYRCVDFDGEGREFVRYDFNCPEGLVFDEPNSVCNWPADSEPCDTRPGGKDGPGRTTSRTPGGSRTTSGGTEYPSKQTTQTTSSGWETTKRYPDSTETSKGGGGGEHSGECTEEGFFRNPEDCNRFYRCVDQNQDGQFIKYDFKCPEGLVFDEENSVCNWPDQSAPCDGSSTGREKSSTSWSEGEGSWDRTTTPSRTTWDRTTGGSWDRTTTPSRTTWDRTTEGSWDRTTTPSRTTWDRTTEGSWDRTTTPSRTTSEGGKRDSTTDSSGGKSGSNQGECTEEGFFRNPEDCSKFYRCVDFNGDGQQFVRYDFDCPEGLVFDEVNSVCNWPNESPRCDSDGGRTTDSGRRSTSQTRPQTTTEKSTRGTTSRTTQDSTQTQTTSGRWQTTRGTTRDSTQTQTTSGRWQTTTERSGTSTRSSTKSGTSFECTEPGFFRCPEDCTKFYRCVEDEHSGNLVRYDFQCPDGLIFDERRKKCDWPSSKLTCDTEATTASSTFTRPPSTRDSQTRGTSPSGTTAANGCTEEGFFRNPDDCSKYYRCIDEGDGTLTREDFECENDEVFDEEMNYCNRKDLAPPCDGESTWTEGSRSTTSSAATTSRSSSGSGECEEEGFHRDPNDCNKFYRCVDFRGDGQSFTRYDFVCPEGLVFDESVDVCNWPSSVPSCESGGESKGSTGRGTSTDGTRGTTTDSTATSRQRTTTTSRERTTTTARERTTTTSRERTSTTSREQTSTTPRDRETTSYKPGTSTSSERGTSRRSGSSDIECTEAGFFRHPDDCSKFYRCVDFAGTGESYVRYDFDCPDGLHFDEVNSVCNWPTMTPGCDSGSRGTKSNTESGSTNTGYDRTTTSGYTTTSRGRTTRSPTSTGSSEEFQCEEEGFYKHPTDCKKYYECKRDEDTGELVKIDCECPDGHVWDNEGWYCNAAELSPPCESDGSSSSSFKCTKEGFFRDPEDCTRYYQCNKTGPGENDFSSERYQCDDGLVFDEEGRYCNAPELSEPCDGSSSTSRGTTAAGTTSDGSSGDGTTRGSTSDGSSGDGTTRGSTSDGSPGDGTTSSGGQGECTSEGFFRNPDDCTKYYQCSRNEETGNFERSDYSCPDGRIFDEGLNYCNEPELSEEPCDSGSNTEGTTRKQSGTESTTSDRGATTGGGSTTSAGTRSGGSPQCTQAGFFRHPDDCNKFYRCVDFSGSGESFVRYDFDCPEGLHFDEVNSVCNWPTMTPPCESSNRLFLSKQAV